MQSTDIPTRSRYAEPLDAIVLAGTDRNPRRLINGQNKALLEIAGQALVRRVVDALLQAESIGQVFVVGPVEHLQEVLAGLPETVVLVPQAGEMLANAWQAIDVSEERFRLRQGHDDTDRPLLFISSDLPLVSAAAVDDFVGRCAAEDQGTAGHFSMLAGVAEEASLLSFYPEEGQPGIVRPYVHLADCRLRLANIYVGRPRTLAHQEFLQTGFEHRKAEKWKNVLGLAWRFLGQAGGLRAAWFTLRLQATLLAARGPGFVYRLLRRRNTRPRVEQACSTVLGGPVKIVITPYGGLSLDVDNDQDFAMLSACFEKWSGAGLVEPRI
jgi:GTP:adenosylcobinamide-phosphate guanylyltransferase